MNFNNFNKSINFNKDNVFPFIKHCNQNNISDYYGDYYGDYYSYDSKERFIDNLKVMPENWKYRYKKITYRLNSDGYRTKQWNEINWRESIVVLGCSIIFGMGLDENETLCYKLSQMTNMPVINMGYTGGSNQTIVNNACSIINNFETPKAVIISWTGVERFLYFNKKIYNCGEWIENIELMKAQKNPDNFIIKNIYKYSNYTIEHMVTLCYLLKQQINALFKDRVNYIDFSLFELTAKILKCEYFSYIADARDRVHPGETSNEYIAKNIFNKLKETL